MALKPLFPSAMPVGTFDGYDTDLASFKGGEVVTLRALAVAGTDLAAADAFDGYVNTSSTPSRPAVTRTLASGNRLLYLADEGIAGYGTLFGSVVGGVAGKDSTGTVVGPSSATASGKITIWGKGIYAISLDAVDTTASTGFSASNTTLAIGDPIYATTSGVLTPNSGAQYASYVVARFLGYESEKSLVTSSIGQVQALNSPVGSVALAKQLKFVVIDFNPGE